MTIQILATKLFVPQPRSNLVSRPGLIERLNEGWDRKLTILSAPAGFGKTTLLSEWVQSVECPVAWLSLEVNDNNLFRFLTYFAAVLQAIDVKMGEAALAMLQSSRPPHIETVLTSIINDIAGNPSPHILILDDYHLIDAQPIHEALTFLLEHLPPQIHLVISSRSDPPINLSRLRGRGQLVELRASDLRFKPDEITAFLTEVMGLTLSAEEIAALDARTEGWIVGLQMAALSIQAPFSMQTQNATRTASFISTFTGSHRYILDYFSDEILLQQPEDIQTFLLQTSILDRLTGPLCDFVTGRKDGQEMLKKLDQANLFIIPLDNVRRWYRYHQLFVDILRKQLVKTQHDLMPELQRLASTWYKKNGLISEAVRHMLAIEDIEGAARMIEENALAMMDHGDLITLASWLDDLPDQVVRSRPLLCVAQAWPMAYAGQREAVESLLQDAEKVLTGSDDTTMASAERKRISGHIAAIRSCVLGTGGELSGAAELAQEALAHLPEDDLMARGWAAHQLGFMLRISGELTAAEKAFVEAIDINQAAGHSHVVMLVRCELATLQTHQGQLRRAAATCQEVIALAETYVKERGQRLPVTGHAFIRLSAVLREWNDLETAIHYAREGLELCRQWGQVDGVLEGYIHLSRALQASGDADDASGAMQKAIQVAKGVSPWFETYAAARQARLWLSQGNVAAATRWTQASNLRVDDEISYQYMFNYLVLIRLLINQGQRQDYKGIDQALGLALKLLEVTKAAGANLYLIETLVLQALIFHAQGEDDQALVSLERALVLAEPEGFVRLFIDEGAPMAELLLKAVSRGISVDYTGKLLEALEGEVEDLYGRRIPVSASMASTVDPSASLPEPLTERECQVMRLISTGLSNQEIAEELYLSINTIKTHTKSIYSKLNVRNRTQAVNRAKELGIL
jgi:LuxR family maltose regulon positive regulatory protein